MRLQHWIELTQAIDFVARGFEDSPRWRHPTAVIVRVFCWAAIHNCSILWATDPQNWVGVRRPKVLPDQSTLSRRTRTAQFRDFLESMSQHLRQLDQPDPGLLRLLILDGKPMTVAAHSRDTHASFGRGAGQKARGYKLHAIWGCGTLPLVWRLAPLNVCEKTIAARLLRSLPLEHQATTCGYLLADGYYDSSKLFDHAARANLQLIAPRQHPGHGLGHHYHSPHRRHCIAMLERPAFINDMGQQFYAQRREIERQFGNLTNFSGGLIGLPAWVRRYWRVRNWVHAKLLINACRIRCLQRKRNPAA